MKDTGMVRRIDELGRIVIPKEIRRVKRIKEGTPVEIAVNKQGDIVLNKYSPVFDLLEYALEFCEVFATLFECAVLICDTDKIIACKGCAKSQYLGKLISGELSGVLESKREYIGELSQKSNMFSLTGEDISDYTTQVVVPIVSNGDLHGGIILVFANNKTFDVQDIKAVKVGALFIAGQIES